MYKNIDNLAKAIKNLKKQMQKNACLLNKDIDDIILAEDRSHKRIEQILDILLDYSQLNVGKKQFDKLNKYYATFNKNAANSYWKARDE